MEEREQGLKREKQQGKVGPRGPLWTEEMPVAMASTTLPKWLKRQGRARLSLVFGVAGSEWQHRKKGLG